MKLIGRKQCTNGKKRGNVFHSSKVVESGSDPSNFLIFSLDETVSNVDLEVRFNLDILGLAEKLFIGAVEKPHLVW